MKKNYFQEKLTWLRLWLTILVTMNSACFAWLVNNFAKVNNILIIADLCIIFVLASVLFVINQKIRNYIENMEENEDE
jgi:hypothetical protein